MEQLYTELRDRLGDGLQTFNFIGEDTGQLEALQNSEETPPFNFPAVFILMGDTEWQPVAGTAHERGRVNVVVRMAFDCYDDTCYTAGQDDYAVQRLERTGEVHALLQGFRPDSAHGPLVRHHSRSYALPGGIKVYENEYTVSV